MRAATVIAFLFLVPAALANGEQGSVWAKLGLIEPLLVVYYATVMFLVLILFSLYYQNRMGKTAKKVAFILIVAPIVITTVYLAGTTIYLNLESVTGGPVHWHADYEVWACGEEHELVDPEGFDNKVGTSAVHEHNDNRIHVEGVLLDMEEASLHEYFESVGGELTADSLTIPMNDGIRMWTNGDLCNGQPARWYIFVNGELEEDGSEHIIAPYPDVPPGDVIKLVFTEKPADQINTNLMEAP